MTTSKKPHDMTPEELMLQAELGPLHFSSSSGSEERELERRELHMIRYYRWRHSIRRRTTLLMMIVVVSLLWGALVTSIGGPSAVAALSALAGNDPATPLGTTLFLGMTGVVTTLLAAFFVTLGRFLSHPLRQQGPQ